MSSHKSKALFIARLTVSRFFDLHPGQVYFWTFTEPGRKEGEAYWTKDEAEAHFKPFADLCSRRGYDLAVFWEPQKRGAWHPHCLVSGFFDVNWLRAWMVKRGWGVQMRVEWLHAKKYWVEGKGWVCLDKNVAKVIAYLTKYLTKGTVDDGSKHKKRFGCRGVGVKAGTTKFKWAPWEKPGAYLYAAGLDIFVAANGRCAGWRDVVEVIRMGAEVTQWAEIDPLWNLTSGP